MTRKTLLLAALPLAALAFDDNGSYFEHKDWEIACDNTGTCRAAGYQAGYEAQAISLLLVRDEARMPLSLAKLPSSIPTGTTRTGKHSAATSTLMTKTSETSPSATMKPD